MLSKQDPAGYRVSGVGGSLLPQSAAFFSLEEIRAYDPITFMPYDRFLEAVGEHGRPGWVNILDPTLPALAFLGVRYIFDQPQPPRRLRRLERERRGFADIVYRGHDAVVWERPDALPRVFFPHRLLIEPDTNAALRQARQLEDFAAVAVVDRPAEASSADSGASEAGALVKPQSEDAAIENQGATVEDLTVGRGYLHARVWAPSPAILASSQPAIPGWELKIDGRRSGQHLRRINGAFLGVAIPSGSSDVVLHYAPRSWHLGLTLALTGGLCCAFLWRSPSRVRSRAALSGARLH